MDPIIQQVLDELPEAWVDGADEGFVVCDSFGEICYLTATAQRLLSGLCPLQSATGLSRPAPGCVLGPRLQQLIRRLLQQGGSAGSEHRAGQAKVERTLFGPRCQVRCHASLLEARADEPAMIALTLRALVPLADRLGQRIGQLGLPRRQAEVCLLLACGRSYCQIAAELGVSENTAITHGRAVYRRLDVRNRAGLLSRLMAQPGAESDRSATPAATMFRPGRYRAKGAEGSAPLPI
jgi:DNA-binding CsgD family transcriptional regulator